MQGVTAQAGVGGIVLFPKERADSLVVNRHPLLQRLNKDGQIIDISVIKLSSLTPHQGALVAPRLAVFILQQHSCGVGCRMPNQCRADAALAASAVAGDATGIGFFAKLDGRGLCFRCSLCGGYSYDAAGFFAPLFIALTGAAAHAVALELVSLHSPQRQAEGKTGEYDDSDCIFAHGRSLESVSSAGGGDWVKLK